MDGQHQYRLAGWRASSKTYYGATRGEVAAKLTEGLRAVRQGAASLGDERQRSERFLETLDRHRAVIGARENASQFRAARTPAPGARPRSSAARPRSARGRRRLPRRGSTSQGCHHRRVNPSARCSGTRSTGRSSGSASCRTPPRSPMPRAAFAPKCGASRRIGPPLPRHDRCHHLAALIVVAVSCGFREGEMLGLRWPDLDLNHGVLRVRHALERLGKRLAAR